MKTQLIALTLVLFSVGAGAAQVTAKDACTNLMPCGVYEGTGSWYDTNGKALGGYNERIEIAAVDDATVNIKVYIYSGSTLPQPWTDSNIVFDPSGGLKLVDSADDSHAAGFCANKVCTIAFRPVPVDDGKKSFTNSFVDILRFDNSALKRYNMVADSPDDHKLMFQRSDLQKK